MFDKLYKEANDEIQVNTLLLEKLKSEASKGERKKTYSFMYKYGFAAATILIVVVSLNIMPDMKKSQEIETKYPGSQEHIIMNDENAHIETSESLTKEEAGNYEEIQNSEEIINGDITSEKKVINDNIIITPSKKVQGEQKTSNSPQAASIEEKNNTNESLTKPSDNINKTKNTDEETENIPQKENSIKSQNSNPKKEEITNDSSPKNIITENNNLGQLENDVKKEETIKHKDSVNKTTDNISKTKLTESDNSFEPADNTEKKEESNNNSSTKNNSSQQTKNIIKPKNIVNTLSDNTLTAQNIVETDEVTNAETESFSAISEDNENDITNFALPNSSLRSSDGGGGASSAPSSINIQQLISLEEYCMNFGFNPGNWSIPSNMTITDGKEVYITQNSGEYLKTNHTVIYSGDGKTIYITLLPDSDDVSSLINSGNGEMYKANLILKNTDSSYTSYIVKNGNGYIVQTNNLEKENVYSLIDSIS